MKVDKLYKALQSVALGYSEGSVSVDILIKACENYKLKTEFEDDYEYQVKVAKSCYDSLNHVKPDEEINKAILPGQTKVIDGVMYIYSVTKVGSKTEYDWHVVKKGAKTGKEVGKGSKLSDQDEADSQKLVNSLFPKDLDSLKVVNQLGGSTGAVLVQDVNGNQYVMKRGKNTSNDHVRSEYLTNQIYEMLGIRVPKYELYDDNGEAVLLSKFIPLTHQPTAKDAKAMGEGFMSDVLLANWDVYQNDNCLIDSAGRVIRVDNGSGLFYRAQGKKKTFDADIQTSFNGMKYYNPTIFSSITESEFKAQVKAIQNKKADIIGFLQESGQDELADIMSKRIDNMSKIFSVEQWIEDFTNKPIPKRTIKSKKEQERVLTDEELEELWENAEGNDAYEKLHHLDGGQNGSWSLLNKICELRGFNGLPKVVTDKEYWKIVGKNARHAFFRGIHGAGKNGPSFEDMAESAMFSPECYYGHLAAYGQGIYVAGDSSVKVLDENNYKQAWSAREAYGYSQQGETGFVMKGAFADDTKFITYDDIQKEVSAYTPSGEENAKLKAEITAIQKEIDKLDSEIDGYDKNIEDQVFAKMHYDADTWNVMQVELDTIDWGARDAFGERDIPSFDEFVGKTMVDWVKAQGGSARIGKNTVYFNLPNSDETLVINKLQYDGPYAIKRKNSFSSWENYAADKFLEWMTSQHAVKVHQEVEKQKELADDDIVKLKSKKNDLLNEKRKKENTLSANSDFGDNVMDQVARACQRGDDGALGLYAALKGYDVIEAHLGGNRIYYAVLNRTKMIYSNGIIDSKKF